MCVKVRFIGRIENRRAKPDWCCLLLLQQLQVFKIGIEKKMLQKITSLFLAVGCVALFPHPSALADRLSEARQLGELTVGVSDTTPPFSFRNKAGELDGYDVDLVKAVARKMHLKLVMTPLTSAERIPLLQAGGLDFVATSMTRTPERLKDIDFSFVYFVTPHAVIVKKSSPIESITQLAYRTASSVNTSTAGGNLLEAQPLVKIKYVRDYSLAFQELKTDTVDAFTTDQTVLSSILKIDGHVNEYRFIKDFTKSRNVGFALKKNEDALKGEINKALLEIESSGEINGIWQTWFGPNTEQPMVRGFKITAQY
jgi:polar amino acid transport system substrate-binding protein